MNQSRFNSLFAGLNEMAKKVYSAVPAKEPWLTGQIYAELARMRLSHADYKTVSGCLNTLVQTGLVKEPSRGRFIREPVKEKEPPTSKPPETVMPKQPPNPAEPPKQSGDLTDDEPLEKLAALSANLAEIASSLAQLHGAIKKLSGNLDTAALEIQELFAKRGEDTAKLREFFSTLKSLTI